MQYFFNYSNASAVEWALAVSEQGPLGTGSPFVIGTFLDDSQVSMDAVMWCALLPLCRLPRDCCRLPPISGVLLGASTRSEQHGNRACRGRGPAECNSGIHAASHREPANLGRLLVAGAPDGESRGGTRTLCKGAGRFVALLRVRNESPHANLRGLPYLAARHWRPGLLRASAELRRPWMHGVDGNGVRPRHAGRAAHPPLALQRVVAGRGACYVPHRSRPICVGGTALAVLPRRFVGSHV